MYSDAGAVRFARRQLAGLPIYAFDNFCTENGPVCEIIFRTRGMYASRPRIVLRCIGRHGADQGSALGYARIAIRTPIWLKGVTTSRLVKLQLDLLGTGGESERGDMARAFRGRNTSPLKVPI